MLVKAAREVLQKTPQDIVVLSAVRSAITRAFKGGFKDAYPEETLMPVCREASPEASGKKRTKRILSDAGKGRSCKLQCNERRLHHAMSTTP